MSACDKIITLCENCGFQFEGCSHCSRGFCSPECEADKQQKDRDFEVKISSQYELEIVKSYGARYPNGGTRDTRRFFARKFKNSKQVYSVLKKFVRLQYFDN